MFVRFLNAARAAATGLALLGISTTASASLIGDEIQVDYFFPDLGAIFFDGDTVVTADASDAVFINTGTINLTVDPDDASFDILFECSDACFFNDGDFNGLVLSDLDWVGNPGEIVGIDLSGAPDVGAIGASFTADSVSLDFQNWTPQLLPGSFTLTVDLDVRHRAVPAPLSLSLVGLGLVAFGWARRR